MKKVLPLALVAAMALSMTACQSGTKDQGVVSGATKAPDGLTEITVSMFDRGQIPASDGTYENNDITKSINEGMNPLGVNVKWMSVPRNDAQAKFNAMIAAGTNPDIIWEYDRIWMDQLRQQKVILPLDEIIDKYSTKYKEYASANASMLAPFVKLQDGKTYAFTSLRKLTDLPVAAIWYRQDMLEKVGVTKAPESIEELIDAARKVRDGIPGSVPISGSLHYGSTLRGVYGIGSNEVLDGDNVIPVFQSPNYYDTMTTMRLLWEEGLVDREYITDTNMTRQNQLWTSGTSAFTFQTWANPVGTEDLFTTVEGADPQPLGTVSSKYGKFMLTPQSPSRIYTMFTTKMDDDKIQAGVKFIDWLLTDDNAVTVSFGRENEHFKLEDGFRQQIIGSKVWPGNEYCLVHDMQYVPGEFAASATQNKEVFERSEKSLKLLFSNPIANVLPYDFSDNSYSQLMSDFKPKQSEIETRMITGGAGYTIEQGIQDLQAAWDSMNGTEIWAKKNEWYQANKAEFTAFRQAWVDWMTGMAAELPEATQ